MNKLAEKIKEKLKNVEIRAKEIRDRTIELLKDNVLELLVILGIINISTGAFIYSTSLGFVVLGMLLLLLGGLVFLFERGGD